MFRTIWHVMISLDGFVADTHGDTTWVLGRGGTAPPFSETTDDDIGAVLAGRGWYDDAISRPGGLPGQIYRSWDGPLLVASHHRVPDPLVDVVSGDPTDLITAARVAADGADVEVCGSRLPCALLAAGLIDRLEVHVTPVMLGAGIRFAGGLHRRLDLDLDDALRTGERIDLRYVLRA
ncbi:dihydrofolate reductase family protein [Microbacterium gorillae]|uniref:dihydrofolate reductase family protein n=1 Tax=Microbacterium gorillae TaxID=1231063 RepID=UPI0006948C3A|nr:dihydrofolate reductase family protein [Microbacterium gorillae]